MGERITVVLPVDAPAANSGAATQLAPRLSGVDGKVIGVVDNGLWRSMRVIVDRVERALRERHAVGLEHTPFDHLASDFDDQQRALWPFGRRVAGAVAGLGN